MEEIFFEKLREKVLPYFEREGHGFDHVDRVYKLALKIIEDENIDIDIVKAAVLLHDIARSKEGLGKNNICHAEEGAKMAVEILKESDFPDDKIDAVAYAISVHRYRKGSKAETEEAKILQDADRLDALGAVIITRMMEFVVKHNLLVYDSTSFDNNESHGPRSTVIGHIRGKLLKMTPDSFYTKRARELAKGRYEFVKDFAERYVKEVEGEW
ncbi:HD domain-containing protein [Candidatus Pacearchaeota archaeon]|nr:HD domain-containing protein [Candidatus Pacearchaeota archaeon]